MVNELTGRISGVVADCYRVVTGPRRPGHIVAEHVYIERWAARSANVGDTVTVQMRSGRWVVTEVHG
jgi:hypothetical protein